MMPTMIYIVGVVVVLLGTVFYAGYDAGKWKYSTRPEAIIPNGIAIAILWPLILTIGCVVIPFYIIYDVGQYFGIKAKHKKLSNHKP
jgi:hypothetical protein